MSAPRPRVAVVTFPGSNDDGDARLAEVQACRVVFRAPLEPSRGCLDAEAIVALGEARAVELLFRSGFPRVTT